MAGLFLRYCAPCNSTQTLAVRGKGGLRCKTCDGPLKTVDAHALIPALGNKLDRGQRADAVASLAALDNP